MLGDYKIRLKARIAELGMTDKQVCEEAGVSPAFLSNLWAGKTKQPGVENLYAVCRVVGWKIYNLFDDGIPERVKLAVQHRILSNEMWTDQGGREPKELQLSFLNQELVVLEVETNDYRSSGYRRGDVVAGVRSVGQYIDNHIGAECIVQTETGQKLFKVLAKGSVRGRYTLKSFDPAEDDLQDVKIKWAAPIQMILRGML